VRIDPRGAKKWERRRPVPLSRGHLPDQPQIDGYSKGGENLRARREAVKYLIIQTLSISVTSGTYRHTASNTPHQHTC